jgi:integrase
MKINFNLRDCKAVNKTSIVLVVRHYQKTLKLATGLSISPTAWDVKKQRPVAGKSPYIREQLNQLEAITEKVLASAGYLTQTAFSRLMGEALGTKEPDKTPYLLTFARQFCASPQRKELKTAARILYNFIAKDENVLSWDCIDWDKARAKDVRFDSITWEFRNQLIEYCLGKGFAVSYAQLVLKRLGQFINESRKAGHHSNSISKEKGFAAIQGAGIEKAKNIPVALTLEELTRLYSLTLSGKDELIRDCFLIGCLSGQRWSDYGFINPFQVRDGLLTIHQQEKTESYAEVELDLFLGVLPFTLGDLLAKYGNSSPQITDGHTGVNKTADVRINERIKELCKAAGIIDLVRWSDDRGGKIKQYNTAKCELIGTHTARRTFATVWYNLGMPCEDICSVTGHTSTAQLMEYIGATMQDKRARRRAAVERIKANRTSQLKAI